MKNNYTFYLISLIIIISSFGCSQKPQDIKLSDLHTACDYIDAVDQVCDVAIELKGEKKINDLTEEDRKKYEELKSKAIQIAFAGGKKYTGAEFEECPKQKELAEKIKKAFDGLK